MPSLWDRARSVFALRVGANPDPRASQLVASIGRDPAEIRRRNRGMLASQPYAQSEFYQDDVTAAIKYASQGNLSRAAAICRAARSDGLYAGILGAFTASVMRLPRKFHGDQEICDALQQGRTTGSANESARSLYDDACSAVELAQLLQDGRELGVMLGEIVLSEGMDYPRLVRLDPYWLRFDQNTQTWIYDSVEGPIIVEPGGGRFLLATPGGRVAPWCDAAYAAVGRAWVRKVEAQLGLDQWMRKLAGAARVGTAPIGATVEEADGFLEQLIEWSGVNSSFVMPSGYTCALVESNGIGYQSYLKCIESANFDLTVAICGQNLTTTGGEGFANGNVGLSVASDITKRFADVLCAAINDQFFPFLIAAKYGSLDREAIVELVTKPAKDRVQEASALTQCTAALSSLIEVTQTARAAGVRIDEIDARELMRQFNIPTIAPTEASVSVLPAPRIAPQLQPPAEEAAE